MSQVLPVLSRTQFFVSVGGLDDELRVLAFEGREALSSLYLYQVTVVVPDAVLDMTDFFGRPARLEIIGVDEASVRSLHGVITRVEQGTIGRRFAEYHIHIEPSLGLLAHRHCCRIYQNQSVPDILRDVFKRAGIGADHYEMTLGNYPPREFCVQYRESDLNFVCRLMEEEGIYFSFRQGDGHEVVVIVDNKSVHTPIEGDAELRFAPPSTERETTEAVTYFRFARSIAPGKVTMRDFNYLKPGMNLQSDANKSNYPELELYDYPGNYLEPERGRVRARTRMEAIQSAEASGIGRTSCRRMSPGRMFTLTDHDAASLNQDYLITEVTHSGRQAAELDEDGGDQGNDYDCHFRAIPAEQQFRPLPMARRPYVEGVQTAQVVGPTGEEIYTDEYGRVKVQFHWDREGKRDERSSCWIRVSQPWAGAGWGGSIIPRIGQEVIVDFLEGDPDRPIIIGRVYNGANRPPGSLPASKAQMSIMSNSTPGGGGANELRMDDSKGREEFYINASYDQRVNVTHDRSDTVGNNETRTVVNSRTRTVGLNESVSIGANSTLNIGGNQTTSVAQNKTETIAIASAETIGVAKVLTIGAAYQVSVGGLMNETVGAAKAVEVALSSTEIVGQTSSVKAKKITLTAEDELSIKVGSAQLLMKKNGDILIKGNNIKLKGSKIEQN